jgi:spore germination protein YaaH
MRRLSFLLILLFLHLPLPAFSEMWVYLMKGEEPFFSTNVPITDLACFSAQVDADGNLKGGHTTPPPLSSATSKMRFHLVITIPWNSALAHLYLDPKLPLREHLLKGILDRSAPFDGVQIDFEGIASEDGTAYLNFLTELKKRLPTEKMLSVAVSARWKSHKKRFPNDAYDYAFIGLIADRVIVMAYDEHYGGGTPGPIASLPWCEKIYEYACETIPPEKLIMGIPFYGRSWQTPKTLSDTYRNQEIRKQLKEKKLSAKEGVEGGSFCYEQSVSVSVFYETKKSIQGKIDLYKNHPIRGVAFWRIGQEPEGFWESFSP